MKRVKIRQYGELHQILDREFYADVPDSWDVDNLTAAQESKINKYANLEGIDWIREDGIESGDYADEAIQVEEAVEVDPASVDLETMWCINLLNIEGSEDAGALEADGGAQ